MFIHFAKYLTWHPDCHYIGRNVFCHHASCTNHNIISNRNSRHDNRHCSNPAILSYMNRRIILVPLTAQLWQNRMPCRSHCDIRTKHCIITHINMSVIDQCQIEIGINIFPKMYMSATKVRVKWRFNITALTDFRKHLF